MDARSGFRAGRLLGAATLLTVALGFTAGFGEPRFAIAGATVATLRLEEKL